jgi:hypothetical protein
MDATTATLVGVAVGGAVAAVVTIINSLLNRRHLRAALDHERDERRIADLRAWRDRSTPALAQARNLLTTYHAGFPKAVGLEARHLDGTGRSGYVERIAKEIDERSRAVSDLLTEIGSGHPSQNVRDLAEEVRTIILRHCSELRDQLMHNPKGNYDFRPDHDRAREVLVELTNALHATTGGKPDPMSVILDR